MPEYVILVTFDLAPNAMPRFLKLVTENGRLSLELEAGCLVFDILRPANAPDRVVLYERYADRPAFAAHCRSAHFLAFGDAVRPLVKGKSFIELAPQEVRGLRGAT